MVMNGHRGIQYMHAFLIVGLHLEPWLQWLQGVTCIFSVLGHILKLDSGYKGLRVYFLFLGIS